MHKQKTVSTYLYLLYVTQADTKPKRSIWMWTVFWYWTFAIEIRGEVGYLFDIWNIEHSKFDIQILVE